MQTNKDGIAQAIARTNQTTQNEILNLSRNVGKCPEVVRRFYEGSALSLWELKQFVGWKSRLPNDDETIQILHHGVGAMKKLFKVTY